MNVLLLKLLLQIFQEQLQLEDTGREGKVRKIAYSFSNYWQLFSYLKWWEVSCESAGKLLFSLNEFNNFHQLLVGDSWRIVGGKDGERKWKTFVKKLVSSIEVCNDLVVIVTDGGAYVPVDHVKTYFYFVLICFGNLFGNELLDTCDVFWIFLLRGSFEVVS